MGRLGWRRAAAVLLLLCFFGALGQAAAAWPTPRMMVYETVREVGGRRVLARLAEYEMLAGRHFYVLYTADDAEIAPLVLAVADEVYTPVVQLLGYAPPDTVPLVIYPDRATLRQAFGWQAEESAMGAYWLGVIKILSPKVWMPVGDYAEQAAAFRRLGPVAHELAHHVLDHRTRGNYPRWFTEGLAQWVEYQVTGYLWLERGNTLHQPMYSLTALNDRFDALDNQALAYRQSFLLVDYLVLRWGHEGLMILIDDLEKGVAFAVALEGLTGLDLTGLERDWRTWLAANLAELEAAGDRMPLHWTP